MRRGLVHTALITTAFLVCSCSKSDESVDEVEMVRLPEFFGEFKATRELDRDLSDILVSDIDPCRELAIKRAFEEKKDGIDWENLELDYECSKKALNIE